VPLSEDEQRILHEMEQKLYEHDRSFASRVRPIRPTHRQLRWPVAVFAVGFAVVVLSFSSSLLLATFGFLLMVLAALIFERNARHAYSVASADQRQGGRARPAAEHTPLGRRLRGRFFEQH
jgi:Protein of unknown function (DUF3040)